MKVSAILTLGAASLVSAQSIGQLVGEVPTCADSCLLKYIPMVCSGGVTDYGCSCMTANKQKITEDSTSCILSACGTQKALQVESITNEICSVYSAGGGSSSASATSSAASSSSSSASSSASSSMSSSSSSASSASSAMSSMTSAMASSSSSAAVSSLSSMAGAAAPPMITAAPALAAAAVAMFAL